MRYTSKTLPRQPHRRRESPKGAALNNRRRGGAQRRRTYGQPNTARNAPEGDAHRKKSGHARTPIGTICTPIFAPFGDAHSIRPLTVGSSGFALFTYGYSKKPPSGTAVVRYTSKTLPRQPHRRRESPKGAALNNRRRGDAQRRRTYGQPNTARNAPEGDAHRTP